MPETSLTHRRFAPVLLLLVAVAAGAVALAGCSRGGSGKPAGDGVVVTIFPLYDLVRQVAGPEVKVTLILPPGVSSHGYTPSPADVDALNYAALLVANGGGIDDWVAPAYRDRAGQGLRLVHLVSTLGGELGEFEAGDGHEGHDHAEHGEDHHDHAGANPHVWLVPRNASKLVAAFAKELAALYPDRAAAISQREAEVQEQLAAIDVAYEDALEPITDRRLITFHDAFNPLAEEYELNVVATVLSLETHDVTPARLQQVRRFIDEQGVRAVFIEPQFDSRAIEGLGGAVRPRLLDPLGDPNRSGYETYDAMMRTNLDNLVQGLRDNVAAKDGGG